MRLIRSLDRVPPSARARVVTLGNFDGVHLAHQAICRHVVEAARALDAEPVAITFHPHPVAVLAPDRAPVLLLRVGDRVRLLGEAGVETVVVQHFSRAFSRIEAEDFVRRYFVERLGAVRVVVGHNVRFGRDRKGDGDLLRRLAKSMGFEVDIVGPVVAHGVVVSSTSIRRAIHAGDLEQANALLGREYFVRGRVIYGSQRGAGLGFPTANLRVRKVLLPPDGVYAVRVIHADEVYGGVANLGFNPTFGADHRSLEAHLFDFHGDLYGERLQLSFVHRLRSERKFANAAELAEQIRRDAESARAALAAR